MQPFLTLVRRELANFFLSLTGYVIIGSAVFLMGFSFVVLITKLQRDLTPMPLTELFYMTPFFWLILLLGCPMITMRLFSQEKFTGTFETLMTAPVSDFQVVAAKFCAAMLFYLVVWLPLLICLLLLRSHSSDPGALDYISIITTYLGILLLGGVMISMGCLASALTKNQVTAAMVSMAFGVSVFLIGVLASQPPSEPAWQAALLSRVAVFDQMHDFARGVLDTRPALLYLSLTGFFLFLTLRVVESRRWN